MKTLHLTGPARSIEATLNEMAPGIPATPAVKIQMERYQLMALYVLARQYNHPGARFLEIGTGHGGSAFMLSKGAPLVRNIQSWTVSKAEADIATGLWRREGCMGVTCMLGASWDVLATRERDGGPKGSHGALDLVFIDGDHNQIARDLPWFNQLRTGGLLICHDYSPSTARSASPVVFAELNLAARRLGRPFDVTIVDDEQIGMAGFYRRKGEAL